MKFSSIAFLAGLAGLVAATPEYTVEYSGQVVCTDQTTTVTETQYVTVYGGNQPPAPTKTHHYHPKPPLITTSGGVVTSIDYGRHGQSTVYVYPTGDGKKDITRVIYEIDVIVEIVVINVDIIVVNGATQTVTTTLSTPPSSTPPPGTGTNTNGPPAAAQTHLVQVGVNGTLAYGPNQLNASLGDVIRFEFLKLNHTVTQSSLADPCTPLPGGFDSGFNFFNPGNVTDSPSFTTDFIVNSTKPLWFYCRQSVPKSHCHAGMVLGVNPGDKFDEFLSNAESAGQSSKRDHVRRAKTVGQKWSA